MRGDRLGDFGSCGARQPDAQYRAGAVAAVTRLYVAPLCLDKAAADRQPESGPGAAAVLRLDAVEFIEDAFEVARRNAGALIADLDYDGFILAPRSYLDAAFSRRVFGGVVEQIEQHLLEQYGVEPEHRQIVGDVQLHVMAPEHAAGPPQRRAEDFADVEEVELEVDCAGFEAGHVEQIADEAVETLGLILQRR